MFLPQLAGAPRASRSCAPSVFPLFGLRPNGEDAPFRDWRVVASATSAVLSLGPAQWSGSASWRTLCATPPGELTRHAELVCECVLERALGGVSQIVRLWVAKPAHHAGPLFLPQLAAAARHRSSPYSGFARMGKTGDSHPRASPSRSRAAHRRRDGGAHRARGAADARRDRKLASLGFRVLRLDADLVERALPEALARVRQALGR